MAIHVSLDFETLSLKPDAVLLSIGACTFDTETGEVGNEFYLAIDPRTQHQRHISADTVLWWHSRTIWVNVIAAGLLALEASTGMLQPLLPVNLYTAIAVGLPVVNAMMRIVTSQAIRT